MTTYGYSGDSALQKKKKEKVKKPLFSLRLPHGSDLAIHLSILWLAVFGLLMIASASMGQAVNNPKYLPFTVAKQAVFLAGGYIVMHWMSYHFKLDFLRSRGFSQWAIWMGIALMVCLIFTPVNGARAWIRLPIASLDVSVQPSEFTKIMGILIVAAYCGDIHRHFPSSSMMVRRPFMLIGGYLFIVWILQSDLGSAVVIGLIAVACFLIPQHPQLRKYQRLFIILMIVGVAGMILILSPVGENIVEHLPLQTYQKNRILSAINPFTDQYNTGYQLINGLVSFASGGWTGLGFGNSVRKYTDFPAANTDFILAIIVEELGYVGFLMVFIPYIIIIWRLFHYASKMNSERGRIILVGVAMYILVHCLFNIGGVTGLIPLTGVPLLMISAGGSSTVALMMAIGIAQAVIIQYRKGEIE
ncbi:MAG: FtsW/RodA/SpoVE family cell cycle protein [Solobacterium sp.]|jgi:cell division protein FtsW|nr:FtsW/RodA/SpoVE family cell cycle protein [Solobacterium sp.]MCH4222599.1 FtsW/RodA/SpoVE family cell cycle protein [Solobacterium sp.]MCH4265068.1 FtsW/RodA/SpoVE family cell cycle protein [Solobacterium sp.]